MKNCEVYKNHKIANSNSAVLSTLAAGLVMSGILIGIGACQQRAYTLRAREYASFPVTNITAEAGNTISGITARGVDTDIFVPEMRYDQFTNDNPNVRGQRINRSETYKIRVDPNYVSGKSKK